MLIQRGNVTSSELPSATHTITPEFPPHPGLTARCQPGRVRGVPFSRAGILLLPPFCAHGRIGSVSLYSFAWLDSTLSQLELDGCNGATGDIAGTRLGWLGWRRESTARPARPAWVGYSKKKVGVQVQALFRMTTGNRLAGESNGTARSRLDRLDNDQRRPAEISLSRSLFYIYLFLLSDIH